MPTRCSLGIPMRVAAGAVTDLTTGVTVGLPPMFGLLIACAPEATFSGLPSLLRPIVANGFVMGAVTVIVLEHGLFRKNNQPKASRTD